MSRFTPDEIALLTALLTALLNHHKMSMGTLLRHPGAELTESGRAQYLRDIEAAERLKAKLADEYADAVRIPGVAA